MLLYIFGVIALIKKHLQKVEESDDKILLVNQDGEVTEVSVDSFREEEDEVLV